MIIFFFFASKPYAVTPHLNCLSETVHMRGNTYVFMQNEQIIANYYQILSLIMSSDYPLLLLIWNSVSNPGGHNSEKQFCNNISAI